MYDILLFGVVCNDTSIHVSSVCLNILKNLISGYVSKRVCCPVQSDLSGKQSPRRLLSARSGEDTGVNLRDFIDLYRRSMNFHLKRARNIHILRQLKRA